MFWAGLAAELTLFEKLIYGPLFGGGNRFEEIPRMIDLYRTGKLKLDELITARYTIDEINRGYQHPDGRNIRGVVIHDH